MNLVSGVAAAAVACALAIYAIGPMARFTFGPPLDFDSDYTSLEAMRQALAVFFTSFIVVFFVVGYSLHPYGASAFQGLALASPLTIAAGFGVVRHFSASNHPDEYVGLFTWAVVGLGAPWVSVAAAALGAHLRCRRSRPLFR